METYRRIIFAGSAVPDVGAEDADRLVRKALRVLRIEVLRPVDARVRVPLEVLRLLVEAQQRVAALLVLPAEGRLERAGERPRGVVPGQPLPGSRSLEGC